MRRFLIVLFILVAACSSGQELAPINPDQPIPTSVPNDPATTPTAHGDSTTSTGPRVLAPLTSLAYEEIEVPGFPIHLVARPGEDDIFLAVKDGRIFHMEGGRVNEAILDIRAQVRDRGEQGLLAIALHPTDADHIYVHYSATDGDTVVSEFAVENGQIDRGSERVLLRLNQPAGNHNGGMIQFGPDGRLYLGLGDGGRSGDAFGHGQNRNTLFAGLVAIDVATADSELFQYGLRNPWRFWIEGETIYIADVGQGAFEEISVALLEPDINYGWPITEGLHCFRPSSGCDTAGLTLPVVEVPHSDSGTCSITGGVVYRGSAIPELHGTFLFSDFCGGYLRGLSGSEVTDFTDQVGNAGNVASFGTDGEGEVYVLTADRMFKLVAVRG